eukprot:CAMPEP_0194266006 /NCGR_PEP_ID=MMETSP0169-20130528/1054_1 /TAXON_ID=218684 /ORGANISM="Corethron pennatum, Strain L29A3" /LENGTH=118 /DNA_ID=CAMNT_0039006587 /DNA_START=40 /DNA_END=396 /DNA_ORIENTATION=-
MNALRLARSAAPALRRPAAAPPRRTLASEAAAPAEGLEGQIRAVLDTDEKVVMGVMGLYVGLYGLKSLLSGGKAAEAPAAAPVAASTSGAIPDIESPAFEKFIESEENISKLIASWEK